MKLAQCLPSDFLKVFIICALMSVSLLNAQQPASSSAVPRLVNFSGKAADSEGKTITGIAGVTFAIYKDQSEGAALWLETQNVQTDANGNYTVQLGATKPGGLPPDLFSSGEARWLGVTVNGGTEQPRALLLSVPYALKALDSDTLGGRPASAFMIAPTAASPGSPASQPAARVQAGQANQIVCASGTACKAKFFPLFSTNGGSAKVTDSIITQSGAAVKVNGSASVISTASAPALLGQSSGTNAVSDGVDGVTSSGTASGVAGINSNKNGTGLYGVGGSAGGIGVFGTGFTGGSFVAAGNGYGIVASANNGSGNSDAGFFVTTNGTAVEAFTNTGLGVAAEGGTGQALVATNSSTLDTFVASNSGSGFPMFVGGSNGGVFVDANGDFTATGSINGAIKNFRIDHPLDPANKYLNHTSIESSEMLNLYTGNAVLDANGAAKVTLPAWFTAVNEDFRYQLTPVGAFAPLYIAEQFTTDHFVIAGGQPGMKVSWQITGVRHDAYAKAHPLAVEEVKGTQRGLFLHPELYGATKDKSIVATHLAGLKSTRTHAWTSR